MRRQTAKIFLYLALLLLAAPAQSQQLYEIEKCEVTFLSYAELEIIKASNQNIRGLLDVNSNKFYFKVLINAFEGFNNPQQRIHFQEKFLETEKFPYASFEGKTIEKIEMTVGNEQEIRIKGKLTVHGRAVEKLITVFVTVKDNDIQFRSAFNIVLEEHEIRVPKIVKYNIAEEIAIDIDGVFTTKK